MKTLSSSSKYSLLTASSCGSPGLAAQPLSSEAASWAWTSWKLKNMFKKMLSTGAGEKARLIKCLLHNHGDPGLSLSICIKSRAWWCIVIITAWRRQRQADAWESRPVSLLSQQAPAPIRRPCLKKQGGQLLKNNTSSYPLASNTHGEEGGGRGRARGRGGRGRERGTRYYQSKKSNLQKGRNYL